MQSYLLHKGPPSQYNEWLQEPSAVEAYCDRSHVCLAASERCESRPLCGIDAQSRRFGERC